MESPSPLRRLISSVSFWIFAVTFLVRLVILSRFSGSAHFIPQGDDMAYYNGWALRILDGQLTDGQAFYGLPGYPWVLAGLYSIFGLNLFIPSLLQAIMEGITSVWLYRLGVLIFDSKRPKLARFENVAPHATGILAALTWTAFLPTQAFSIILMPTAWMVCAFWFCVWRLAKMEKSTVLKPWLGFGVFIGLVAMLIATIFCLLPLFLIAIWRTVSGSTLGARLGRTAAAMGVLLGGIFVGTSPAWIHNYFIAKEPVFLTAHSGINEWIGNNPAATGYPKMPPGIRASQEGLLRDSITLAEREAGRKLTRAEVSAHWSAKARAWRSEHRGEWFGLLGTKLANFWNAYQYDDLSIIKLLQSEGVLPPGIKFGMVAALGLPWLLVAGWMHRRAWWVAGAVLCHMAVLLTVFVTERYRLAAVPGLIILAAYGLVQLWRWTILGRWMPVAVGVVATFGAAWFVSIPRADLSLWSLDHYKIGIRAIDAAHARRARGEETKAQEELARAQHHLETAFAYVPENAEINFALGNLWYAKGDSLRTKLYYRRTLELEPRHSSAYSNLGVIALEEKRPEIAENFLQRALAIEPDDYKTMYLLARARYERNDLPGARQAINEALKYRPNQSEFLELLSRIDAAERAK